MPTVELLEAYADAFNRHDIDAIMNAMTTNTVFIPSSDTRIGSHDAVRDTFSDIFASYPDAKWSDAVHSVSGNRGISEWMMTGTDVDDGSTIEVRGCDIFTFEGDLIAVKDSYLKSPEPSTTYPGSHQVSSRLRPRSEGYPRPQCPQWLICLYDTRLQRDDARSRQ